MISVIKLNIDASFNDLYFSNINEGIIVGDEGKIIYTTDGGVNFHLMNSVSSGSTALTSTTRVTSTTKSGGDYYITVNNLNGFGNI